MLNRFALLVHDGTTLGIPLGTRLTLGTLVHLMVSRMVLNLRSVDGYSN